MRFGRKAAISLAVFALSFIPYVGRLVLPAASFYTFNSVAGLGPAAVVFGTGIFLPRRYLVVFLQSYFSSRSLMRELVSSGVFPCVVGDYPVTFHSIYGLDETQTLRSPGEHMLTEILARALL